MKFSSLAIYFCVLLLSIRFGCAGRRHEIGERTENAYISESLRGTGLLRICMAADAAPTELGRVGLNGRCANSAVAMSGAGIQSGADPPRSKTLVRPTKR